MPRIVLTPWRHPSELLEVREWLYPSRKQPPQAILLYEDPTAGDHDDMKRKACDLVGRVLPFGKHFESCMAPLVVYGIFVCLWPLILLGTPDIDLETPRPFTARNRIHMAAHRSRSSRSSPIAMLPQFGLLAQGRLHYGLDPLCHGPPGRFPDFQVQSVYVRQSWRAGLTGHVCRSEA